MNYDNARKLIEAYFDSPDPDCFIEITNIAVFGSEAIADVCQYGNGPSKDFTVKLTVQIQEVE